MIHTKKQLDFILQEGEGFKIEFKESLNNIDKEIVAFANSEGGRIFLGIDDNGKIRGINITNKLKSQIQDIANNCDPAIRINFNESGNILIIDVPPGKNKPYRCSSGFFIRQGPNSQKMKTNEIIDLINEVGKIRFDEIITSNKEYDSQLLKEYLGMAGIKSEAMDTDNLFNLGVSDENGFLNNAGILFFTKNPKLKIINAYITCARYKGTEKVNVIDRKDFEENLVVQVEQAVEFVKRNTRLEYEIKGLYRKEIPEYPIEAIREAILNAVMHRDYFEKGANVQVDIFDDRLTITNIGGLIKPLTKEKLGTLAVRRNPLIAELFHRIHLVEKMGTGIKRIREECKKHGNINFEVESNGYFIATFRLKEKVTEKVGERKGGKEGEKEGGKEGEKITENQKKILKEISKDSYISSERLSQIININISNIEKNISKLKKKGLLQRIGPAKGGHWKVLQ